MPGTGIQILWSREFSSEVDMIMLSNKIQKPGKMVQLGRGLPGEHGDPSPVPRICTCPGQCTPAISVPERQRQEDSSQ